MNCFSLMLLAISLIVAVTLAAADPEPRRPGGGFHPGGKEKHGCGSKCTCEDPNKEAVEVFASTAAGALKSTICVTKQICYKVCDAATCVTPTIQCVPAAGATTKPGQCPTIAYPHTRPLTTAQCTADSDCHGKDKCCVLSPNTVAQCTEPVGTETKCGTCPSFRRCYLGRNPQPCTEDANCPSSLKCCPCRGSTKCMRPWFPLTAPDPSSP